MMPLRIPAGCFVLLLLLMLSGCTDEPSAEIRFAIPTAPTTLDPRLASDALGARVGRLLYAQLTDFDEQFQVVPSLARWEKVDHQRYRFTLRADRRSFSDGSALDARDVVETYRFVLNPANGSPHRGALSVVESVDLVDSQTLEFRLKRPDPLFPGYLNIGIVPAASPVGSLPPGSGAFAYKGSDDANQLLLERRADGQLIRFLVVRDPSVRVLKLMKGEVDLLQNELPPELVDYLAQQDDIEVERFPGINFSYLGFNLDDPVLSDPRARQAIAHALNREELIEHLWRGGVRPAESILGPQHWAGTSALKPWTHNPNKARKLLAELGHDESRPLVLSYKTTNNPFRLRIATVLQHQLKQAGIDLRISSYDWGTFFGDVKAGRFQLYSLTWVGIKSPDIFRYVFHSESIPPDGANRGRYRSSIADDWIEKAEAAADLESRSAAFRQVQKTVHEDLPYVPLWYEDHFVARRSSVEGYEVKGDGAYDQLISIKTIK